MAPQSRTDAPLEITTLDEFSKEEQEIVRRVNERPNGAQLMMIDPLRLLQEVKVRLSERALAELQERADLSFAQHSRSERVYAAIAAAPVNDGARIVLRGLLKGPTSWR
jgi:hypothetical protein